MHFVKDNYSNKSWWKHVYSDCAHRILSLSCVWISRFYLNWTSSSYQYCHVDISAVTFVVEIVFTKMWTRVMCKTFFYFAIDFLNFSKFWSFFTGGGKFKINVHFKICLGHDFCVINLKQKSTECVIWSSPPSMKLGVVPSRHESELVSCQL